MTDIRVMAGTTATGAPQRADGEVRPIDWIGYLFVGLFALPFFLFNILPVLFGGYVAFTRWGIVGRPKWVGLGNFAQAFSDHWVAVAFKNVLLYGLIVVPCVTALALLFA